MTDIGYGLRTTSEFAKPSEKDTLERQLRVKLDRYEAVAQGRKAGEVVEQKNSGGTAGNHWQISFEDFKRGIEPYTLDFVAELAKGDDEESIDTFRAKLMALADLVCDTKRNLMSFWCMGFNQHQRGVWVNELVYSMHLLLGKHGLPGNGAFSLTGQPPPAVPPAKWAPSATDCFRHARGEPEAPREDGKLWKLPAGTLNPRSARRSWKCCAARRRLDRLRVDAGRQHSAVGPEQHALVEAMRRPDAFVVVSDIYPTYSARAADLILPAAAHFEKWGSTATPNDARRAGTSL